MGRKAVYGPCPSFSKEDMKGMKMGTRWEWYKNVALAITTVFSLTFLGLFVWQLFSKPANQPGDCQVRLQNQTTQMQNQLDMCTEALKKDRDKFKEESDDLHAQLLIATQNVSNSRQHWDSCQKELHTLQGNITSWNKELSKERAEKQKLQEEIKQLQQQISQWKIQETQELSKDRGTITGSLGINFHLLLLALLLL